MARLPLQLGPENGTTIGNLVMLVNSTWYIQCERPFEDALLGID